MMTDYNDVVSVDDSNTWLLIVIEIMKREMFLQCIKMNLFVFHEKERWDSHDVKNEIENIIQDAR